jgi:hypothetical protein
MPKPTSQSPADVGLAEEASRIAKMTITAGQIKRWRKAGLVPMERRGLGRGRGFAYRYPVGSAEFAAAIAEQLRTHRRLDDSALAAFASGVSPTKAEVLVRLLDPMKELGEVRKDPHRVATRLADKMSRRASAYEVAGQVKRALDRPGQLNEVLRGAFSTAFTGEGAGIESALQLLRTSEATAVELSHGIEDEFGGPKTLDQAFDVLARATREASLAEFERARDYAIRVYGGSSEAIGVMGQVLGFKADQTFDLAEAMSMVPMLLAMRRIIPEDELAALVDMWANPMSFADVVIGAMREWATQNPADAAILGPIARTIAQRTLDG